MQFHDMCNSLQLNTICMSKPIWLLQWWMTFALSIRILLQGAKLVTFVKKVSEAKCENQIWLRAVKVSKVNLPVLQNFIYRTVWIIIFMTHDVIYDMFIGLCKFLKTETTLKSYIDYLCIFFFLLLFIILVSFFNCLNIKFISTKCKKIPKYSSLLNDLVLQKLNISLLSNTEFMEVLVFKCTPQ